MKKNNEFFNPDVKERFLDTISNPVVKTFSTFPLRKAKKTEEIYNKDLYEMTESQLREAISDFTCTSLQAVMNYVTKIEEYIDWTIEQGYRKSNLNPLSAIDDKTEWSKGLVAQSRNYYFTREDIIDLMDQLANDTDKAVLLALFEGIKGKGFSEILNLRAKDITEKDGRYWVKLKEDDGEERTIQISKLLADTLEDAADQKEYISKNGQSSGDHRHETTPFDLDSPYIFKKTNRGKQGGELTFTFVNRKFVMFKEVFGLDHLKSKHITDSGILHMADQIAEDETITTSQIIEIANHYDTTYTHIEGGVRHRNTTVVKRIIEMDAFEELYGYKMKFTVEK